MDDSPVGVSIVVPAFNEEARLRAVQAIFPLVEIYGWAFDIEVLTIARVQGLRIVEVPIEWHYRRASRISLFWDGISMFTELLRIRARARRGQYGRSAARQ